jgi:hypothetical protein
MRIGIFETDHFEVTCTTIRLFDNDQHKITVFTYEKSYRQLQFLLQHDMHKYEWVVKPEQQSKRRFIYTLYKETKKRKIDLLILNTITDNHLLYAWMIRWLKHVRVVVTLHDINNFFQYQPAFNFRRFIRIIGRRQLIRAVHEFNVIALTMVDYLKKKLPPNKQVHSLPGGLFDASTIFNPTAPRDQVRIVVPGTVDERRRHYDQVFELVELCERKAIPVMMVLLGGYDAEHGKRVLEKCKGYKNIRYYDSAIVDQPEFDKVMNEAHMVFTPSVVDTIILDGVTETYGISISSGNLYDVVRHAKPWIIPQALTIPANMENSCMRYATVNDIGQMLQRLLQEPSFYLELSKHALNHAANYTKEQVRLRNPSLFGNDAGLHPLH